MPDPEQPNSNGAAEPQRSLRDIAESVYDDLTTAPDDESEESSAEPEGQQRDERGRFVKKESQPGEAEAETPPSPDEETQEPVEHPAPETGVAAQPPANWSAEDRAAFAELTPKGQEFLLRRHSEMESDYQKRVQATAFSNQFVQAVTPVFNDPDIAESLRQTGRSPIEAVYQWAGFHKRALGDLNSRITLLFDLANQMQIDPAAVFGLSPAPVNQLFTQEQLADPATKKFADHIGQMSSRLQALEAENQRMHQAQEYGLTQMKRAEIDQFADQRNADGSLAHPYFDWMMPVIQEHYAANQVSIEHSYNATVKALIDEMSAGAKHQQTQQQSVQRAQQAVRGNTRGLTAPVSKPAPPEGKRGLRQILEESASEVGFEG
jgi:hypothetical protein